MKARALVILPGFLLFFGCRWNPLPDAARKGDSGADEPPVRLKPLPIQQIRAYPETVTGDFVSLADFEAVPGGESGHRQVQRFNVTPHKGEITCQFVVNITRTGTGAIEVKLVAGTELVFNIPGIHDFSSYSLLSMAVHSRTLRDDFCVTLASPTGSWTSHRMLLRPGWNTVLIDIQRLGKVRNFDIKNVRTIRIRFADAAGPVSFNLDDIMVINNRRTLSPTPPGVVLEKNGLDYRLTLKGYPDAVQLTQGSDGLWRWSKGQPVVQFAAPGKSLQAEGEQLSIMGRRRVGHVRVIEKNKIRVRLANTWYFPTRAGEWASMAVRRMRWEYTFYGDGRWVTHLELNNAGGRQIGAVRLSLPHPVAWGSKTISRTQTTKMLEGPVGKWSCLSVGGNPNGRTMLKNYTSGGTIKRTLAAFDAFAPGDVDRDGFDESQGCYFLRAKSGHCRFVVIPPPGGLLNPVFRVAGRWAGPVSGNSAGQTIRDVVRLGDGSVLFRLSGWLRSPVAVEVSGRVNILSEG